MTVCVYTCMCVCTDERRTWVVDGKLSRVAILPSCAIVSLGGLYDVTQLRHTLHEPIATFAVELYYDVVTIIHKYDEKICDIT